MSIISKVSANNDIVTNKEDAYDYLLESFMQNTGEPTDWHYVVQQAHSQGIPWIVLIRLMPDLDDHVVKKYYFTFKSQQAWLMDTLEEL